MLNYSAVESKLSVHLANNREAQNARTSIVQYSSVHQCLDGLGGSREPVAEQLGDKTVQF